MGGTYVECREGSMCVCVCLCCGVVGFRDGVGVRG